MADNPADTSTEFETPGPILKAARKKAGLSAEDLARELNLSVEKLEALESDRYESLPSEVFAQGYLRRYGKLVNVDENMLVQRFKEHLARKHAAAEQQARAEEENAVPTETTMPKWLLPAGVFVAAIVVLALIFLRTGGDEAAGPTVQGQVSAQTESATPEPQPEGDVEAQQDPLPEQQAEPLADDPIESGRAQGSGAAASPDEAETVIETEVATPDEELSSTDLPNTEAAGNDTSTAPEASAASSPQVQDLATLDNERLNEGGDTLSFAFSEDCWVEVSNAEGRVIHADLAEDGETLQLNGRAPFSIMLGNAQAVDLSFNGEAVPVNPRAGQRTIRFTVGG